MFFVCSFCFCFFLMHAIEFCAGSTLQPLFLSEPFNVFNFSVQIFKSSTPPQRTVSDLFVNDLFVNDLFVNDLTIFCAA